MDNKNKFISDLFPELDEEGKKEVFTIWEQVPNADPANSVTVTQDETETALQNVAKKTMLQTQHAARKKILVFFDSKNQYIKLAAAAVLLICALGLGYILTPVTVSVPYGKMRTIHLPDKTRITLNSGSILSYARWFNILNRDVTLTGEAYFDVTKSSIPFHVKTSNASVKVLGTKFNVRSWPSSSSPETYVYLEEGRVSFKSKNKHSQSVILRPGEFSRIINHQDKPTPPAGTDKQKVMAWRHHGLSFEDQPLSTIFAELQRRFDIIIHVRPDIIMNQNLTIYLSDLKGPEQTLHDICQAKGLTYTHKNNVFVVSDNP